MSSGHISAAELNRLQANTENIRNICILAHVDHGKTTMSDFLISSNGVISSKMAGKVRYLDSRDDEQERCITMKTSSISLLHESNQQRYLVNLIDSPGHIDFSSEVSNAVRVSDGALVLIDALEGVQTQTHTVLRQARQERLRCVLVINKIDRLLTELQLTPMECFQHMNRIVEQVNAIASGLLLGEAMENAAQEPSSQASHAAPSDKQAAAPAQSNDDSNRYQFEIDDSESAGMHFAPEKGNVLFASAFDCWAFSLLDFATFYSKKLGMSAAALQRCLWGDYFYHPKTQSVSTKPPVTVGKGASPMFVQFVMEPIATIYKTLLIEQFEFFSENAQQTQKIIDKLELKVPARDIMTRDWRVKLQAIMSHWMPLAPAVLDTVVRHLPSPLIAQPYRIPQIWPASASDPVRPALMRCESVKPDGAAGPGSGEPSPVMIFVAKMVAVPKSMLNKKPMASLIVRRPYVRGIHKASEPAAVAEAGAPGATVADAPTVVEVAPATPTPDESVRAEPGMPGSVVQPVPVPAAKVEAEEKPKEEEDSNAEVFIAFARIFSGTLRPDSIIHVFSPKYDPLDTHCSKYVTTVPANQIKLFLMMGREIEPVDSVPAGNVFGIAGLEKHIMAAATLSSLPQCTPFRPMAFQSSPIVRVAVEPKNILKLKELVRGLKLLQQADPNVEVLVQESGEHVIVTAGELHLERCIRDLHDRFAPGVDLKVSAPIVSFRESLAPFGTMPSVHSMAHAPAPSTINSNASSSTNNNDEAAETEETEQKPKQHEFSVTASTANKLVSFTMRAIPLSSAAIALIDKNATLLKRLRTQQQHDPESGSFLQQFLAALTATPVSHGGALFRDLTVDSLWSFGPKWHGSNVLLLPISDLAAVSTYSVSAQLNNQSLAAVEVDHDADQHDLEADSSPESSQPAKPASVHALPATAELVNLDEATQRRALFRSIESSIVSGFQLATAAGPLCEEPMRGVAFRLESINVHSVDILNSDPYGPLSGQVMAAVKDVCRKAYTAAAPRLMEPVYKVELQASAEVLGRLYGVVARRRGTILDERLREGTNVFTIIASMPVAESFGFADELRKKTSGVASPQLVFSHWSLMQQDPFFVPTTEDELAEFGAVDASPNLVRTLVDGVRRRKGLHVEEKLVQSATKQRTLSKKA